MRSGLGFAVLLAGVLAASGAPARAEDVGRGERLVIRLPQQPDFSAPRSERRDADALRLRIGPEDTPRADRIALGAGGAEARLRDLGVRDGARFGDRGRLYLFAADGQTAVGYNLTHGEGGWSREGLSIDGGAFMGEAQAGIAWRQGDFQTSFGYVQRTIEKEGRIGRNLDEDIVALHVSFTPGR
ncbi:MAG: hypothetical protein K1X35_12090 [Caulobacteraceae bacterium]|nr:hypothetical protein [Caulobacteraceae bacterium]